MKKTYITPSNKVKEIKVQNILAGSLSVDISKGTSTQYGKNGYLYFDEEEEDF